MTSQPQPEPLTYTDGGAYVPVENYPPRPKSITVLAIMGIVIGALGLLCKPGMLVYVVVNIPHPVAQVFRNDSFVRGWTVVSVATGWLISLLLLLSAVGSLRLRDWGRAGMLAYAFLALVMTGLSMAVNLRVVNPALEPAMKEAAEKQPGQFQMKMSKGQGIAVGIVIGLWYPALILYFFNRRVEKQAFIEGPPPSDTRI
jgi:hypothetical protein